MDFDEEELKSAILSLFPGEIPVISSYPDLKYIKRVEIWYTSPISHAKATHLLGVLTENLGWLPEYVRWVLLQGDLVVTKVVAIRHRTP